MVTFTAPPETPRPAPAAGGDGRTSQDSAVGSAIHTEQKEPPQKEHAEEAEECAVYGIIYATVMPPAFMVLAVLDYGDRPARLVLRLSCLLSVSLFSWACFLTRALTTDPAARRIGRGTLLGLLRWIVDAAAVAVLAGAALGPAAAVLAMYAVSLCLAGLFAWCLGEYLRTRRNHHLGDPPPASSIAGGGGRSNEEVAAEARSAPDVCATQGIMIASMAFALAAMATLQEWWEQPADLVLWLSCLLCAFLLAWSSFVSRALTPLPAGRVSLCGAFWWTVEAGAAAAVAGAALGAVAAMMVMYAAVLCNAGLFAWCLVEYLRVRSLAEMASTSTSSQEQEDSIAAEDRPLVTEIV